MKNIEELYRQLLLLTKKQRKKIMEKDYEKLLELLNEKNEIMEEIEKIDIKKYFTSQENPRQKYNKVKELMERIKEIEDNNMKRIKENYSEMKDKLKEINIKEKSRKGYQKLNSGFDAKFIDKKS
ncbi:MAG: hypothetical protein ACOCRX_09375 [Candidatus Woesearchaeota archaeon]